MPSTVIRAFRYDPASAELTVTFTISRRYVYANVPETEVAAWRAAPSKGQYFNAHIRDRYAFREIC